MTVSKFDQLVTKLDVLDNTIISTRRGRSMCFPEDPISRTMEVGFGSSCTEPGLASTDGSGRDSDLEEAQLKLQTRTEFNEVGSVSHSRNDTYYCRKDYYVQIQTISVLLECAFYFAEISSFEAKQILKPCRVGTFLIRDSADPRYLYTISVKTKRGPTSIRVSYEHGRFSLDSDEKAKHQMPTFTSILDLIDFYVRVTNKPVQDKCRFLDKSGRKDLPIILSEPKLKEVPSLKHLCRSSINQCIPAKDSTEVLKVADQLPLPKPLRSYLKDYPYIC